MSMVDMKCQAFTISATEDCDYINKFLVFADSL